tara:strand:+ start:13764 stop:14231 length:468 start_codon:yes stop_codon:yes gene_type:complete
MERVIICPNCGSEHHCFEEMQEDYSSFMCFQCGFMSDSRFNEEYDSDASKNMAIVMNQMKHFDDERKIWWYPSVVNMGKLGMVYPEPIEVDEENGKVLEWVWKYAKVVPVEEGDTDAEGYESKLDVDNAMTSDKNDFLSAIKEMGITKDLRVEKS